MNTIINQLGWLSLDEAAERLAREYNDVIEARHLFRLGLERRLRLSVRLRRDVKCRVGVLRSTAENRTASDQPELAWPVIVDIGDGQSVLFGNDIVELEEGIYDIPDFVQLSGARSDESHEPLSTRDWEIGACLQRRGDTRIFQLVWNFNGRPSASSTYPNDCDVVIRPTDLDRFVQQSLALTAPSTSETTPRTLDSKREANLLRIIHVLRDQLVATSSTTNAAVIDQLVETHQSISGISKSNLENVFADAKRAYTSSV